MRTWKQGAIGKISFLDSSYLYMKCLKYPLAHFYQDYDNEILSSEVFYAFLHLSTLGYIERVYVNVLTKSEEAIGEAFSINNETAEIHIKFTETVPDLLKIVNSTKLIEIDELQSML